MNNLELFYYEWGTEKKGFVSIAFYLDNKLVNCGYALKTDVKHLKYHCPYN